MQRRFVFPSTYLQREVRFAMSSRYDTVKREFSEAFRDMSDFSFRELVFGEHRIFIAYISNFSSKLYINKYVIEPISYAYENGTANFPLESVITNVKIEGLADFTAASRAVLSGNAVVFYDGYESGYGISVFTKNEEGRSTSEPETENVIRGPHEGFTESGENNAMLLRRRLHTASLKRRDMTVGAVSQTSVSVMYLEGVADPSTVEEVCRRILAIKTDAVLDSGYVEIFIQDGKTPLYPTVGNSERPDKVAAKLLEGRIAVIVDGSPVVLTVPFLFCEALQVTEDYSKSPWYATFIRIIRFAAFLTALYLPALFVALFVRHRDLMPAYLITLVEEARHSLPFSLFWEVLIIFLLFEVVREVGLRMPKAVGSAVGLVGSLILGDSAIEAGIASAPVLIVVALAAVCNFIVPPYMNSNILYRFLMIVVSGVFGLYGFFAAAMLSLLHMCMKTSVGVPYFSPFAPMDFAGLKDFLFMAPIWAMKRVPVSIARKEVIRTKGEKR